MTDRLKGKVALITGGASGLGANAAILMAQEGASVVVADIATDRGKTVAARLGSAGHFVKLDVTTEDNWKAAIRETVDKFGALHVLLNSAGIGLSKTVEEITLEEWRHVHAIDLDGVFLGCKHGVAEIKKHTTRLGGSVINISSISGIIAGANMAAYNSAKAGVRLLSKSVALHCAKSGYNIRCNSVHPTFIDTPILDRYRDQLLTFNDDIQGTAAVALGAILGAVRVTGRRMRDQTIVILGAGSASIGVADYLREAMVADGISDAEARRRFFIVNRGGVLHDGRTDLSAEQMVYCQPADRVAGWPKPSGGKTGLADVIGQVDATILVGLSTIGGAFTEPIIREMARKTERPIIFPLSNPTVNTEATPEDLIRWTDGRALVATGSPFDPVMHEGKIIPIAQCNNVYIFPAMGLGLVASGARRVTDTMIIAAAQALAEHSPAHRGASAKLLPELFDLRRVAIEIAIAVGLRAQQDGVAPVTSPEELRARVIAHQWHPVYPEIRAK